MVSMDRQKKDMLLKYLCRKTHIIDFFFDKNNELKFHFVISKTVLSNYALIENMQGFNAIKRKSSDDHVLDLLLDVSRKGYAVSNCVGISDCYYRKIMEPYCSYEQLQIEFDLYSFDLFGLDKKRELVEIA